jgi:hypothetical protein
MALIISGKTDCSICDTVIRDEDEIVATTHFISDSTHSLWRFSDSAMHKSCFLDWRHKEDFIKKYNETVGKIVWGNGTSHHMENDGSISILKKDEE